MNQKELLFEFEAKYKFLYDIEVNGVPIYTCYRNGVGKCLEGGDGCCVFEYHEEKGRIFPKRVIDSFLKFRRFRRKKSLIFSSSMLRRDNGRNLAAEYLLEHYPDAVVFEWPGRTEEFDKAYFKDKRKAQYCPLDYYLLVYKIFLKLNKKHYRKLKQECYTRMIKYFTNLQGDLSKNEKSAIDYLLEFMPDSYASTYLSQKIFEKLFKQYSNIQYAIDFWGSARENIMPVLPGKSEMIELQHGIITSYHPGYIYPSFANRTCQSFFNRHMLVYGKSTKRLLCTESVFKENLIEVIGNPRIQMYKNQYMYQSKKRNLILFTSQPYEQDGYGNNYYSTVIPVLKKIVEVLNSGDLFYGLSLGIKLHPRENNGVRKLYEKNIKCCKVFDNSSQLYELLNQSFLHITATSTTLYEAALFDVPTITVAYNNVDMVDNYGFETWHIHDEKDILHVLRKCMDKEQYEKYLQFLKKETMNYM